MNLRQIALLFLTLMVAAGCTERRRGNERWATTENTNVKIDWDKINEAYKQAKGPADFEQRVNEIYEGDELISVAVHDVDDKTQVVTGFFDNNKNGAIDDKEKIFTIQRDITSEDSGQYQITGHGAYYGYHSPVMSLVTGMMLGSMISSAFRPGYVPRYTQPYVTSTARRSALSSHRSQYRAKHPQRFSQRKASRSGRTYNKKGTRSWGSRRGSSGSRRSFGGGRFGIRKRDRKTRPQRLTS